MQEREENFRNLQYSKITEAMISIKQKCKVILKVNIEKRPGALMT